MLVSGSAEFRDAAFTIADPDDDARASGAGGELLSAGIERPDALAAVLRFSLALGDPLPALSGVPLLMRYEWPLRVTRTDGSVFETILVAVRNGTRWAPGAALEAWVFPCPSAIPAGGSPGGSRGACDVWGSMEGGVLRWDVPMSWIEAAPGSTISLGPEGIKTVPAGVIITGVNDFIDRIAVALSPSGTWSGSLPLPASPGTYLVVAKACYGAHNCELGSAEISI